MAPTPIRRIVESSHIVEAISEEHKQLQAALTAHATTDGFTVELSHLPQGLRPDVLQLNQKENFIFIGDAKNSANETPSKSATVKRIWKYMTELAELIKTDTVAGGRIAIATNDSIEAQRWQHTLDALGIMCGLSHEDGSAHYFQVMEIQQGIFVIT